MFICFEGVDGTGKQTQTKLLSQYLQSLSIHTETLSFPNYPSSSSSLVKSYLSGEFGSDPFSVDPRVASTFYAVDRFATIFGERKGIFGDPNTWIISDRYVGSNAMFQGGKYKDPEEQLAYLNWVYDFEFNIMGLPVPDFTFWLDVTPAVSEKLMKNRLNKFSNQSEKDIHERNHAYLMSCYNAGAVVMEKWGWIPIPCVENGQILPPEQIMQKVLSYLPIPQKQ